MDFRMSMNRVKEKKKSFSVSTILDYSFQSRHMCQLIALKCSENDGAMRVNDLFIIRSTSLINHLKDGKPHFMRIS